MPKRDKKTTMRKQWTRNIMILITGIFIVFSISIFALINSTTTRVLNLALDVLGNVATKELVHQNVEELLNNNQQNENFQVVKQSLEFLQNNSRGLIPSVYMVTKNQVGEWVYIAEATSEEKPAVSIGQGFIAEEEMEEAFYNGKVMLSKIHRDYITQEAIVTAYIPIGNSESVTAILGFDLKADIVIKLNMLLVLVLLVTMGITLFIVWLIVKRMTKRQTKSIELLVRKMREMADLDGDLTQRIEVESNNEIGELAECTNKMLDTIQEMFIGVEKTSKKLLSTSEIFSEAFNQTATSFDEINMTTRDVAHRIESQNEGSRKINNYIVDVSESVNQVAVFSQQVTEEAIKTETNAVDGNGSIQLMQKHITEVINAVDESVESVKLLRGKSNQINSIVDTITAIAGQTNLLALNASIEAARAGEQGRGFVVVADEVRKLAEESSKSAEEIYKLIQEVQHVIEAVGKSMEKVSHQSMSSNDYVSNVMERFTYIVESIKNVSNMVEEVSASTEEMAASTSMINSEMNAFTSISAENTAATDGISIEIEKESESVNELLHMVTDLKSVALELSNRLEKLKLE
ncbi:methyl-accepting chemotaxis protein [Alkaliphilus transvaalensis]|uniref:methyl-accepting chemotaxis protein n=1 Tax=Alkaliphilus transvaalensis TaxID=114628 RepID=UPI000478B9D9|nr:methyl-accepting chemotaxis protein [Alkaliphilus transvaalensis]